VKAADEDEMMLGSHKRTTVMRPFSGVGSKILLQALAADFRDFADDLTGGPVARAPSRKKQAGDSCRPPTQPPNPPP
jgi:hypothetical protein